MTEATPEAVLALPVESDAGPATVREYLVGLLASLWHALNCHQGGCWRIGRHKVKGSPWCNSHHENARAAETLEDKLDRLIDLLTEQAAAR